MSPVYTVLRLQMLWSMHISTNQILLKHISVIVVMVLVLATLFITSAAESLETCSSHGPDSCADAIIPTVDLLKAKTERKEQADILIRALEGVGFIYIDSIEEYNPAEILSVSKWFFSQPLEKKFAITRKQWNPNSTNVFRGYFPHIPNAVPVSNKEAVEFGMDLRPNYSYVLYEPNQWPEDDGPNFKATIEKYREIFASTAIEVMRLLAFGVGLDEHTFDDAFLYAPLSTFRLLHYPQRLGDVPEMSRDGDVIIQCADHKDTSFMTFLATFDYHGLEILDSEENWLPVPPRPSSLLMNIGRLVSEMSADRFKATRHRVIDPGMDRYSIAFFFEPHARTDVNVSLYELGKEMERPASHKVDFYGNWAIRNAKKFYEYRDTDFGPDLV